jgi:hypothetical protein
MRTDLECLESVYGSDGQFLAPGVPWPIKAGTFYPNPDPNTASKAPDCSLESTARSIRCDECNDGYQLSDGMLKLYWAHKS